MARWKYKLEAGSILRDAIENDNHEETLNALRKCCLEMHEKLPGDYTEDDLQDDLEEIWSQLDNLENYKEYNMTLDDCEEEINYLLSRFYEYCDDMGVWVENN